MHSAICLTVQAEDDNDAIGQATIFSDDVRWSDWFEIGGRWKDIVPTGNGVLRYSDNPEAFLKTVDDFIAYTKKYVDETLEKVGHLTVRDLVTNPKYRVLYSTREEVESSASTRADMTDEEATDAIMALWYARRVIEVSEHQFTFDQSYYDIVEYSVHRRHLDERIITNPDKQFLVVMDYHH